MPRRSKSVASFRRSGLLLAALIFLSVATLWRTKLRHATDEEKCALMHKENQKNYWQMMEWVSFSLFEQDTSSQVASETSGAQSVV